MEGMLTNHMLEVENGGDGVGVRQRVELKPKQIKSPDKK